MGTRLRASFSSFSRTSFCDSDGVDVVDMDSGMLLVVCGGFDVTALMFPSTAVTTVSGTGLVDILEGGDIVN